MPIKKLFDLWRFDLLYILSTQSLMRSPIFDPIKCILPLMNERNTIRKVDKEAVGKVSLVKDENTIVWP